MEKLNTKIVGLSLGVFLAVLYVLCVLFDLLLPAYAMKSARYPLLPGFTWLTPSSSLLGLVESFIWGALLGVIFVPIYNYFIDRFKER
jgi:2TM family of unknown function (DUF5676)